MPEEPNAPPAPEARPLDDVAAAAPPLADTPPPPAADVKPRRAYRPRGRRRVAAARRTEKPVQTPRMSFFINDDGSIKFERTTPETIEQLRAAVSKPEARKRLGLVDDAGEPTKPRTWDGMTGVLVDSLNAIAVQAAVNTWKLTDDQARLLFLKNDPAVYGQTVQLSGELLDKYFPGGFGEYDKEISLLLLVGGFTAAAVQKIRAMPADGPHEVRPFNRSTPPVDVDWNAAART